MKKIEINSKTFNKMARLLFAKRGLFLVVFFGAMLVYNFDIIYKNAYLKMEYIDYSDSSMIFDGRKESIMIEKITKNLRMRDEIVRKGLNREYKNIFIYEDKQNGSESGKSVHESSSDIVQKNNGEEINPTTKNGNESAGSGSDSSPMLSN